jgi:hypothetical protein
MRAIFFTKVRHVHAEVLLSLAMDDGRQQDDERIS